MSPYLEKAFELKEAYRKCFGLAKANRPNRLPDTKEHLHLDDTPVKISGIKEYEKAIGIFQNGQKEAINKFAFGSHNGYVEGVHNQTECLRFPEF